MKLIGTVKWFSPEKGYGFIRHPDGDIFVHHSDILEEGFKSLAVKQMVSFELESTHRGMRARLVAQVENGVEKASKHV